MAGGPPDLERGRRRSAVDVVEFGEIQPRDALRLEHDAQTLIDGVLDHGFDARVEHAAEDLLVHFHLDVDVVEATLARLRSVFVEAKVDAGDAADRHAAEFDRRTDVDALHGAVDVGLKVDARTEHAVGAEEKQPGHQQGEAREDEEADFEIVGVGTHGQAARAFSGSRRKKART